MTRYAYDAFAAELERLEDITKGCRADMHEPDEQGMAAKVVGRVFDNAGTPGEMKVRLTRHGMVEDFRLADLVALARMARLRPPLD